MTNTTVSPTLALRIAEAAEDKLAERVAHFWADEARDWADGEMAAKFLGWLDSIRFWASADGRELHAYGSPAYSWTWTPVEVVEGAGPWGELPDAAANVGWVELAPAHHVLRLW